MNSKHVFKHLNQDICEVFERADHPSKVMFVVLDYAKQTHTAFIIDGEGRELKQIFHVENNARGLAFLNRQIDASKRRFAIPDSQVVIGGEDCGSFSMNFIHALGSMGHLVIGVHAKEAQLQRSTFLASTDKLDLLGIAKMLIDRRGTTRSHATHHEKRLRNVSRHRDAMVWQSTILSNRIHSLVDQLFPGFLDKNKSGLEPFSSASCHLMESKFSPAHFRRRKIQTLSRDLGKLGVKNPFEKAERLLNYAREVIDPPPELVGSLQTSLSCEIAIYQALRKGIEQVEKELAAYLATTQGAMLTTIRGTGIVLAAGVASEIGPLARQPSRRRLTGYAGIVPRVKQTGGPESAASHGKVSKRCNRKLKNHLVQCGNHMGQHGPEDLFEDHARRVATGQHADFGLAKRYLGIACHLMRYNQVYLPPHLRKNASRDDLKAYYLAQWPKWRKKWMDKGAMELAFAADNPLGIWRNAIQEIYSIHLPL